jgi:hypothetical protein
MMSRLAPAALVALMVLLMAVTPLSAFLSGGVHETWTGGYQSESYHRARTRVALRDQTGLVRAVTPAKEGAVSTPWAMRVDWYVCGGGSTLIFERSAEGYLLREQPPTLSCFFGEYRSVLIHFWSPIDASRVALELHSLT